MKTLARQVWLLHFECETGHTSQLLVNASIYWARAQAALIDGSSPYYPDTEAPEGRGVCQICGTHYRGTVREP